MKGPRYLWFQQAGRLASLKRGDFDQVTPGFDPKDITNEPMITYVCHEPQKHQTSETIWPAKAETS